MLKAFIKANHIALLSSPLLSSPLLSSPPLLSSSPLLSSHSCVQHRTGFIAHVQSDPRFHVKTEDALLDVYTTLCAKIQAIMPTYFKEIPSSKLEIKAAKGGVTQY